MVAPVTDHGEEPAHGPHHQRHVDAAGAGQHARGRHEDAGADNAAHDHAAPDQSQLSVDTTDQSEHSIEKPHPFRRLSSAFSLTPSPLSLPVPSSLPPSDL